MWGVKWQVMYPGGKVVSPSPRAELASVLVDKKMTYHHGACRYPAALLAHDTTEVDVDVVAVARKASKTGKCRATTNKGKPCINTPQKGEQFCGPHLTQLVARTSPDGQPTTQPDPYDEPF